MNSHYNALRKVEKLQIAIQKQTKSNETLFKFMYCDNLSYVIDYIIWKWIVKYAPCIFKGMLK